MQSAHIDQHIDTLIQYLVGFTSDLLEKYGEFFPVGAYLDVSGGLIPLGVYEGNEQPESDALITRYEEVFSRQVTEGTALAWAIAFDARVSGEAYPEGTDAVIVRTFHTQRGDQVQYVFPYTIREGETEFKEDWWGEEWKEEGRF
jgi:hypothetical protein